MERAARRRASRAPPSRACTRSKVARSPGSASWSRRPGRDARELGEELRAGPGARPAPARRRDRRSRGTAPDDANSWPWNSSGVPGPSSSSAVMARSAPGDVSACSRSPRGGVRDLVVVLREGDEARRLDARAGVPAALLLPGVVLALVEVAPLGGRDQLLRRAARSRCSRPRARPVSATRAL